MNISIVHIYYNHILVISIITIYYIYRVYYYYLHIIVLSLPSYLDGTL